MSALELRWISEYKATANEPQSASGFTGKEWADARRNHAEKMKARANG